MSDLLLSLDRALRQSLDDLADARGRTPEEVVQEALRAYLRREGERVLTVAEGLARDHAGLLRRLGE